MNKCKNCSIKLYDTLDYKIYYNDDGKIEYYLCETCRLEEELIKPYREKKLLTSKLSLQASLAEYYLVENPGSTHIKIEFYRFYDRCRKELLQINQDYKELGELVKRFEEKHWLTHVKKYWHDTSDRGHEANVGKIQVMMWGCAGRVLVTCKLDDEDVTMIFDDSKETTTPRGGIQGIYATSESAKSILETLINAKKIKFSKKDSVKLAGL